MVFKYFRLIRIYVLSEFIFHHSIFFSYNDLINTFVVKKLEMLIVWIMVINGQIQRIEYE